MKPCVETDKCAQFESEASGIKSPLSGGDTFSEVMICFLWTVACEAEWKQTLEPCVCVQPKRTERETEGGKEIVRAWVIVCVSDIVYKW